MNKDKMVYEMRNNSYLMKKFIKHEKVKFYDDEVIKVIVNDVNDYIEIERMSFDKHRFVTFTYKYIFLFKDFEEFLIVDEYNKLQKQLKRNNTIQEKKKVSKI